MRSAAALAMLLSLWAVAAAADLYRWVDPETGSVKFSSYPPPWFGDAAKQRRAPKVEVIPPGKSATAFEPAPGADRERAADPATDAPRDDRRDVLLKLAAQRAAALISSAPDAMGKVYLELVEPLQQLEKLDRQFKSPNPKDEAARLEDRWQIAVPLEAQRTALLQQISSLSPTASGPSPDKIESVWASTQRLLGALGWIDSAITIIDPRKANSRHFEMNALMDRLVAQWEPYVDPGIVKKSRGR
jgi:hypothetical protein